ncbi:MAG TPA: DUF4142 domain-containing protein [Ramlibacter sp.]|nr:DUF4142 domain-containing protein [Ramlibacter sp.]
MVARRVVWGVVAAAGALWVARAARAQPEPAPARKPFGGYAADAARTATRLPADEREARSFLRSAAQAARFEADAARLAATRARSSAIQAFAAELLQHHDAVEPELLRLLHGRGMAPPMLDNAQRKALNRLGKLKGARFDREFVELVAQRRQREDVQLYERAVLGIGDPVLRGWIDRQLPAVRQQQSAAERLSNVDGRRVAGETVRPVRGQPPAR